MLLRKARKDNCCWQAVKGFIVLYSLTYEGLCASCVSMKLVIVIALHTQIHIQGPHIIITEQMLQLKRTIITRHRIIIRAL